LRIQFQPGCPAEPEIKPLLPNFFGQGKTDC